MLFKILYKELTFGKILYSTKLMELYTAKELYYEDLYSEIKMIMILKLNPISQNIFSRLFLIY